MKTLTRSALALVSLALLFSSVLAQQIPALDFFHGRECPHCQNEKKWFPDLKKAYPDIVINEYEVWHDPQNQLLMRQRLEGLGVEAGSVPTNIINDEVVVGFLPEAILAALEKNYGPPAVDLQTIEASPEVGESDFTWVWIVLAGISLGGCVAFFGKKS